MIMFCGQGNPAGWKSVDLAELAKLTGVFDETIYATNSTITKEIAEATIEQRRKWFKEIQWSPPKSKMPRDLGRTQSLSHAEAQTLLKAFEKYGSNLPKSLEMCVDRVTCGICISELPIVLRHIGVEELIVYSGGSTIPQIIKAVH